MSEWVSVEDRLPDDVCECTVCLPNDLVTPAGFDGYCFVMTDDFLTNYGVEDKALITAATPTHWMPLPESPNE